MSVLDVGCGTGAITKGIAEAVGPGGLVVGIDQDRGLLDRAQAHCDAYPNLRFEQADATRLDYDGRFDVVTAARTLQWVAEAGAALERMARAARPGGQVLVLDYNHVLNSWEPEPPAQFARFYALFLEWRASNGWDNEMASHCPRLFEQAGLEQIRSDAQDDVAVRTDDDFDEKTAIWIQVIDNLGPTLQRAQVCDADLLDGARASYDEWRRTCLLRQTLSMGATVAARGIR